ncbi:hypothetical protein SESBI_07597 [Sesbania bispinosa]|nr:hypothetical protein SESBI_07597 [Sesbania bispinosa]
MEEEPCTDGSLVRESRSTGIPTVRTAWRSIGNMNPNSASARENSVLERLGFTSIPKLWSWVMTFSTIEENGMPPSHTGRDVAAAARSDSRRRLAILVGFRPVILLLHTFI